tara:strand:- start:1298 stop:2050 length:753 start_codon:yes stop_codon:yes gene_type:complete
MEKNIFKCRMIIRLDDIAPNMNWKMMSKVKDLFKKYNIKPVIGVIPKNEDVELKTYPTCDFNFWDEIKDLKNQGWEIAMHGYQHLYEKECYKDYLGHGGKTEFANLPYEQQLKKINFAKNIFKENNIEIKSFFAPNHTFDKNTIKACKTSGINSIIDGYGIAPYHEDDVLFFPQLFYRLYVLPFGFQTLQIHLNNFNDDDFFRLSKFIEKNHRKIISFNEARSIYSDTLLNKTSKFLLEKILRFKRLFFK